MTRRVLATCSSSESQKLNTKACDGVLGNSTYDSLGCTAGFHGSSTDVPALKLLAWILRSLQRSLHWCEERGWLPLMTMMTSISSRINNIVDQHVSSWMTSCLTCYVYNEERPITHYYGDPPTHSDS
jgi:hypothetical protein